MSERREWIDRAHAALSVRQQCDLLGLPRSSLYYEPVPDSDLNLRLMRMIDEQYLIRPYFGQRRMTIWLRQQGHQVNVKRVRRLMQIMGLEAIHPGPRLSLASPEHRVFPYLLRGVTIDRPDQVWSTDITYVPLARGFLYLVAVIDWFSRKVLSWELSNSLEVGFCEPWSVLKISGWLTDNADSNALTQKPTSKLFDNSHDRTFRLNQSITATKYKNPRANGT